MALTDLDLEGLSPADVAALQSYGQWCAAHPDRSSWIRLISADEQAAVQWWVDEFCPDALFLLSDGDASNYAAVYRSGPLRGTVLILMHDDEDLAPYFASVQALVDVLVTDVRDFGMLRYAEPSLGHVPAVFFDELLSALLSSDDASLWRYGPRVLAAIDIHGLGSQLQDVLDERELVSDHSAHNAQIRELLEAALRR